jgi:transcriptional regulator with PAS, ATPase and Fis domain
VLNSGKPIIEDTGEQNGKLRIISRFPIFSEGRAIGAIGFNVLYYKDDSEGLMRRIHKVTTELAGEKQLTGAKYYLSAIVGESEGIREAKERVKMIASSSVPVLIQGDTGTGKELIAHAIHQESLRRKGPFVRVNCASIPENLFESELFGYEEGAFTGARKGGKMGKFEFAHQGSIFFDEISELSRAAQAKLLRALQENEIERVGSTKLIRIDARVISASNQPLGQLVTEGKFRKDLMFRLAVFTIYIPPLRSRPEDIPLLCRHYIDLYNQVNHTNITGITDESIDFLKGYHWPGNVRELSIAIERACLDAHEGVITINNLLRYTGIAENQYIKNYGYLGFDLKVARQESEKATIRRALQASEGNRQKAAKLLGISRSALYNKLAELGLMGTDIRL